MSDWIIPGALASAGGTSQLIEVVLGLLLIVAAMAMVAEKLRLPYPILLVIAGMGIGFVPGLPPVKLAPEYVFLLFLPPLLYYSGSHTTWRDFRQNLRPILMLAFGLVIFTTAVVAIVIRALIPEIPWAAAIALGAIVSPPDAVAAAAIAQRLAVPKRIVTILEGESLINDAAALVLYKIAIAAAMTGMLQGELMHATWKLPLVGLGGVAIGLIAGWVTLQVRRRVHLISVEGTIALLTPYVAYLPAEWLGCSGVLAAVAAGVYMSRQAPRYLTGRSRLRDAAVWETLVFLLNGLIFILIGLQLPEVVSSLSEISARRLLWWSLCISGAVIVVRLLWVYPMAVLPRLLVPSIRKNDPMPPFSFLTVIGWAGMRGIVTLAAALALPIDFPFRNHIIFLSFAVILATLVFQGLTLPPMIRFFGLGDDGSIMREEREARWEATHAALARLEAMAFTDEVPPEVARRIRESYDERLAALTRVRELNNEGTDYDCPLETLARVHREVLIAERKMVTFLRDQNIVGDEVLRRLIEEIDLEEAKLVG